MVDITLVIIIIGSVIGVVFVIAVCKNCFCNDKKTSNANVSRSGGLGGMNKRKSSTGSHDNMYPVPFSTSLDMNDCTDNTDWESHHDSSSRNDCSEAHESHSHHDTGTSDHCTSTVESPSTCDTSCTNDSSCTTTCDASTCD